MRYYYSGCCCLTKFSSSPRLTPPSSPPPTTHHHHPPTRHFRPRRRRHGRPQRPRQCRRDGGGDARHFGVEDTGRGTIGESSCHGLCRPSVAFFRGSTGSTGSTEAVVVSCVRAGGQRGLVPRDVPPRPGLPRRRRVGGDRERHGQPRGGGVESRWRHPALAGLGGQRCTDHSSAATTATRTGRPGIGLER